MKIGIIGLPYSGKTTVFNALTGASAKVGGGAATAKPNISVIKVPDERIDILAKMFNPKKVVYADLTFIDVAGLTGEATDRGKDILQSIKTVDAVAHVVRLFDNGKLPTPKADIQNIDSELMFSDFAVIEGRLERIDKQTKLGKGRGLEEEKKVLEKCKACLESEKPIRTLQLSEDETKILRGFQLVSSKPMLMILNTGEDLIGKEIQDPDVKNYSNQPNTAVFHICGKIEMEISQLNKEETLPFLTELGINESGLNRLIRTSYNLLGLISFFTVGEDEVRAWTIRKETRAVNAAGVIHSDIEKGFIRAEVIGYEDLIKCGSLSEGRNKGLLRLEGKEYGVKDGDIMNFRFNV
ncbi:MAG: redox-regulated ATPase YchF [Nitrospinae bacterium RIFCSPLOWO2_02_39_17]|nr:MAG: redox-regulated ATPase YchF [Nitrospinae bacterium RIFCSPHIGHO2_02_39_11]OGW00057.1 MAG: redox-regulated ATPase YchF [Nitrospinae bacterium RIFCSPHIGHO2_12_FULL_39_42]OGW01460.1 MAG: redox-regulated ATPase YchF [Nitrospinae bacterium RIFCSPHIGHO2_02_FULL_39_82]OGW03620.1 MAG: redox-regulated ATPase YchF [Nitrospinae bacterium RIFCSPLOWO2_02_39_17]OGW09785.1 MAG: redox-regulated ATPase YchF [Nitrospinae bacterium RIFCSPLOWO2_12_39_15]